MYKKSFISLLLAVLMVFSMLPLSAFAAETDLAEAEYDSAVQAADADAAPAPKDDAELADTGVAYIKSVGVTGVVAPVAGYTPTYSAASLDPSNYKLQNYNTTTYKNGICWVDHNNKNMTPGSSYFEVGKKYTVRIYLEPASSSVAFDSSFTATVNGYSATAKRYVKESEVYIEYAFTCKSILNDISFSVTAPVIGEKPSFTATPQTSAYSIDKTVTTIAPNGVRWSDVTDNKTMSSTDTFKAGHVYQVYVVTTANSNYEFAVSGDSPSVSVYFNGVKATDTNKVNQREPSKTIVAWYNFPALTATKIDNVYVLSVTEPKPGNSPTYDAYIGSIYAEMDDEYTTSNGWKNGVKWEDENGSAMSSTDKFVAGKKYTVRVSVLRKSAAYEFTTSTKGYINSNPGAVTKFPAVSLAENIIISYTFPAIENTKVTSASFVSVPAPIIGNTPVYSIKVAGTGYHVDTAHDDTTRKNGIRWVDTTASKIMNPTDKFQADHVYSVNLLMAPDTGYEFAVSGGVPAVSVNFGSYNAAGTFITAYGDASQSMAAWYTFPELEASKANVTVKIKSFLDSNENVSAKLKQGGSVKYLSAAHGNNDITLSFNNTPSGSYTVEVSKKNHATREYEITVGGSPVTLEAEIYPIGDVNGDGKVSIADYTQINKHVCKIKYLSDYKFTCADVNGDGNVSIADLSRVNKHVCKVKYLFPVD